jgi:hypothetical protein
MLLVRIHADRPLLPLPGDQDEMDDRIVRPLAQTYRLALLNSWTVEEAGRLAAWRDGLAVGQDWTLALVMQQDFLRWMVDTGRIGGPDDD